MSYITKNLKQKVVFWGSPTPNGFGGHTFAAPVEINGRWEDRNDLYVDSAGKQQVSMSVVYVDTDLVLNGYLYLGELTEIGSGDEDNPEGFAEAFRINAYKKTPNLKATAFERKAWL